MTKAQDRARRVNPFLSIMHHLWAERVLGIPYKIGTGVDLFNSETGLGVEIKFARLEDNLNDISWTIDKEQLAYREQCKHFFWGCGVHTPVRPVHTMPRVVSPVLERQISYRELYLVEPDWVERTVRFRLTKGKSRTRAWRSYLGYAYFLQLPRVVSSYEVRKGIVYFTEGVPEEKFCVEGKRIL